MSFAKEQKEEIISASEKSACCRRAALLGVLLARAETHNDEVALSLDGDDTVKYVSSLVQEFYGKIPDTQKSAQGGRGKTLCFLSKSASKYIQNLEKCGVPDFKCSSCTPSFLRGVFLACGRISDPSKQHSLELGVLPERVEILDAYLASKGLGFLVATRGGKKTIYSRRSETIEDFFALAGMNNTVFRLLNAKINSEVRNNANRVSNCETNNISRTVEAAGRQVELIKELERRGLMGALPEDLLLTARLRVRYEDMSLSQLALAMNPPISKSGLSHRLKRITEIAEALITGSR